MQRLLVPDRKSTRLNSSHLGISYAVFCLKKKVGTNFPMVCVDLPMLCDNLLMVCANLPMVCANLPVVCTNLRMVWVVRVVFFLKKGLPLISTLFPNAALSQ